MAAQLGVPWLVCHATEQDSLQLAPLSLTRVVQPVYGSIIRLA